MIPTKWLWHGYPDDVAETGKILDCNDQDFLKFIVELVQENIPIDEVNMHHYHLGCKTGWTFYLANLKSIYEGGIDLRNKNLKLQGMLNS